MGRRDTSPAATAPNCCSTQPRGGSRASGNPTRLRLCPSGRSARRASPCGGEEGATETAATGPTARRGRLQPHGGRLQQTASSSWHSAGLGFLFFVVLHFLHLLRFFLFVSGGSAFVLPKTLEKILLFRRKGNTIQSLVCPQKVLGAGGSRVEEHSGVFRTCVEGGEVLGGV